MDAFEHVVGELFWAQGYWVRTGVKIDISKADKVTLGNPSMPRPEIDLVAYRGSTNQILAIECKSYLDSRGVTHAELCGAKDSKTYKLFRNANLRDLVLERLTEQLVREGFCEQGATVQLGLVAGKVHSNDQAAIETLFDDQGWLFFGPSWLKDQLTDLSSRGYENQISAVVTKLLLRPEKKRSAKSHPTLDELLDGITPENLHPEIDLGPPVGKEVW
jgi:hypothetical protein